jgi:hypothetical protein
MSLRSNKGILLSSQYLNITTLRQTGCVQPKIRENNTGLSKQWRAVVLRFVWIALIALLKFSYSIGYGILACRSVINGFFSPSFAIR